jgi:hypothetical protein
MKFSSLLLLVVALTFITLGSCVKKYTCHCEIKYSGTPGLPDSTSQEYEIKDQKDNATSKCKAESGTFDNNGIHTVETCILY